MRAIQHHTTGGPEVLELADVDEPTLADDGLLVDLSAAGVNFIDIYRREGRYPMPLPAVPGDEGVGIVREVGAAVEGFAVGDRVAWTGGQATYAEVAMAPAKHAVVLPSDVSDDAGFLVAQGTTAHYLATDIAPLGEGSVALVHAAAGGVGGLLTQVLKIKGVHVIGTVSTDAKAEIARAAGADDIILADGHDFSEDVRTLTDGRGVDVAFDAVGKDTFDRSLASVAPRGTIALYGGSSGPVPPLDPQVLAAAGSVNLARPRLFDFIPTREAFEARMADLFAWMADGKLNVNIGHRYPLAEAAEAHRALGGRATTGKVTLTM